MKKLFITIIMIGSVIATNAQTDLTFKPFKFDIALGYAIPSDKSSGESASSSKGGVLFALEPKYAISDYITLGLRLESALMLKGDVNTGNVKGSASYLATADYYFSTNTVRPFVGAGIGLYRNASADIGTEAVQSSSKFGYMPRLGIEAGHFRTALEYNFAGKSANVNNSYLGLKLGFFIGGGRTEY